MSVKEFHFVGHLGDPQVTESPTRVMHVRKLNKLIENEGSYWVLKS